MIPIGKRTGRRRFCFMESRCGIPLGCVKWQKHAWFSHELFTLPKQFLYMWQVSCASAGCRPYVTPSPSMIDWLRTRSAPFRYAVYVACAVLMFFVAAGVGAAAAVVGGWQFGWDARGSAGHGATVPETIMSEGSDLETTGSARTPEDTTIERPTESTNSENAAHKVSFVHRATGENSRGDYTYVSAPSMNGHQNAIVFASPTSDQKGAAAAPYGHNIGVWYEGVAQRWAIFNQDRAAVPAGASFEVVVPQASAKFVHQADPASTDDNYTYLDNRLTNGKPDAVLTVTQNWNPGGSGGVYNDHPVGTVYDAKVKKWAVYNRDGASMPSGAAFNIAVSAGSDGSSR